MIKIIGSSVVAAAVAATLSAVPAQANDDFEYVWALFSEQGSGLSVVGYRGTTNLVNPDGYSDVEQAGTELEAYFDIERLNSFDGLNTAFTMADYQNEKDKTLWFFGESWVRSGFLTGNPSNYLDPPGETTDITLEVTRCSVDWTNNGDDTYSCSGSTGATYRLLGDPLPPSPSTGGSSSGTGGAGEYIQQFAKSPSMTCDEAQPEGLNWSGAPSGGWGESWAQWPNDGRGGEVCVRTLFYNTSTGKWDVR